MGVTALKWTKSGKTKAIGIQFSYLGALLVMTIILMRHDAG